MRRMNRYQAAARERRLEKERRENEEYDRSQRLSKRYVIAQGPLPEKVWADSHVLTSFGKTADGISTHHVRKLGEGLYLQQASFPGWLFYVCVDTNPGEKLCISKG